MPFLKPSSEIEKLLLCWIYNLVNLVALGVGQGQTRVWAFGGCVAGNFQGIYFSRISCEFVKYEKYYTDTVHSKIASLNCQ